VIADVLKAGVLIFVLAVLQVAAAPQLTPTGGGPDFVVILVVALALWRGVEAAALAGFAGGLLLDAILFQDLGTQSLVYIGCAWAVATYSRRGEAGAGMIAPPPPRPLPWLLAGAFLAQAGDVVVQVMLGRGAPVGVILWHQILPALIQTCLIALLLLPLLRRLFRPGSPVTDVRRIAAA
jgi:rod shape-determining protein MreD